MELGAGGGIRTHEPLRDGSLSPTPLTMLGDPRTIPTPHSGILKTLVLGKMALTANSAGRDCAGVAQSSRALLSGLRRLVSAGSREQSPPPAHRFAPEGQIPIPRLGHMISLGPSRYRLRVEFL